MTARIALALVAILGLAGCGTTATTTSSESPSSTAPAPAMTTSDLQAPKVVRGPIVPDDPEPAVAPRNKRAKLVTADASSSEQETAAADEPASEISKLAKPEKPAKAVTADAAPPVKTADASEPVKPEAPADAGPTPADTAPSTTPAVVESAPTSPAPDAAAKPSIFSNPSAFMQATIGGFPIWIAGLIGLVLLVALAVAFGGRRKQSEVV